MAAEFPDDEACAHLDRQYMFGDRLLVAPVFTASGETSYYIPAGTWTHLQTGVAVHGPGWVSEVCDFHTVPVFVRPGSVIPVGLRDDRPDYPYPEDVTLRAYEFADGARTVVTVPGLTGETAAEFELVRDGRILTATRLHGSASWRMQVADNGQSAVSVAADVDRCSIEL
jgi:alpha-D-xyloside xylohydrolase